VPVVSASYTAMVRDSCRGTLGTLRHSARNRRNAKIGHSRVDSRLGGLHRQVLAQAADPKRAARFYEPGNSTILGPIAASGSDASRKREHSRISRTQRPAGPSRPRQEPGVEVGVPMWQSRAALADAPLLSTSSRPMATRASSMSRRSVLTTSSPASTSPPAARTRKSTSLPAEAGYRPAHLISLTLPARPGGRR